MLAIFARLSAIDVFPLCPVPDCLPDHTIRQAKYELRSSKWSVCTLVSQFVRLLIAQDALMLWHSLNCVTPENLTILRILTIAGTVFYFAAETEEALNQWLDCMTQATLRQDFSKPGQDNDGKFLNFIISY